MKEKPNYWSILTADVRYDQDLKANEKILFSEITALSNKYGYCKASNTYFSKLYGVSTKSISRWINHLKDREYVKVQMVKDGSQIKERHIFPHINPMDKNVYTPRQKVHEGMDKKVQYPMDKKVKENNTSNNKTSINKDNGQAQPDKSAAVRKQIIVYLNSKLHTSYKPNAAKNKKLINARLNEGYSFDDFKKVIDTKFNDWSRDSRMAKYLRPETLFGTKMEGYVNEKQPTNPNDYHSAGYYEGWNHIGNNQPQSSQPSADSVETDDLPF